MWRCFVAAGILLCLSPSFAGAYVGWKLVIKPMLEVGPDKFQQPNQQQLQSQMQHDPVMLGALFALSPVGVVLLISGLMKLRRLRVLPPPPLPGGYGLRPGERD